MGIIFIVMAVFVVLFFVAFAIDNASGDGVEGDRMSPKEAEDLIKSLHL